MAKTVRSRFVELTAGQSITLDGGRIVIRLEEKSGKRARFKVMAEEEVAVDQGKTEFTGARMAQYGIKAG